MPGKPDAARGKKTKKAAQLAMAKKFRDAARKGRKAKPGKGMSPGKLKAMTGKAVAGAASGMSGAGLMAIARKIKPTGRLNAADLDRAKKMMGKKAMKRGGKAKK